MATGKSYSTASGKKRKAKRSSSYPSSPRKMQGGGDPLSDLLGGTNVFQTLFPENTYDFGNLAIGDQEYDPAQQKEYYNDFLHNQIDEQYGDTRRDKRRERRAHRKLNRKIRKGKIDYDSPDAQAATNTGVQDGVMNYFKSPVFQAGLQGIMQQFQGIKDQEDAEQFMTLPNLDAYTIGPDQGYGMPVGYQRGGGVVSTTGYRNDSPDKDASIVIVPGGNISMDNVDQDLLLIPDKGKPVVARARSGGYQFPGAQYVTEMPIDSIMKMQMGGNPGPEQGPMEIQTEKGEEIIFDDYTITPVKAKRRHKNMDPKDPTDVVPPGTWIASRDPAQTLSKEAAEAYELERGPVVYSEKESKALPEKRKLSDKFRKKNETPASVARNIRSSLPMTTRKDIYAKKANEDNKASRVPYINALKDMADRKRMAGEIGAALIDYLDQSPEGVPSLQGGGGVDPISGILNGVAGIGNMITNIIATSAANRRIKRYEQESMGDINELEQNSRGRAGVGAIIGAGSVLGQFGSQDSSYDFLDLQPVRSRTANTFSKARMDTVTGNRITGEMQQAPINTLYDELAIADPDRAQQAAAGAYGQYLNQSSETAVNNIGVLTDLELRGTEALNQIDTTLASDRQQGNMYKKTMDNLLSQGLFQGLGQEGQNYLSNIDRIEGASVAAKMGVRGQTTSAYNNLGMQQAYNINQGINSAADFASEYLSSRQNPTTPDLSTGVGNINPATGKPSGCDQICISSYGGDEIPGTSWNSTCGCWTL